MAKPGRHFFNGDLAAPNVLEVAVDPQCLAPLMPLVPQVAACRSPGPLTAGGYELYAMRPGARWNSDILWIAQDDEESYALFEGVFHSLGLAGQVAQHVDHAEGLVLYSGFFVTRRRVTETNFHVDWDHAGNTAFTLLVPLTPNCSGFGLDYRDVFGAIRHYDYALGKGLLFGDNFIHSTAVGQTPERTALLCFNFGTDRMEHWPRIARTTYTQARFSRLPDGAFVRRGPT